MSETKRGRPAGSEPPKVPRAMVEKLLVEGTIATRADGSLERVYPSVAELARRFGVYPNSIHRFVRELNLDELRAEYAARNPLPARLPTKAKHPPAPPPPRRC